MSFEDNVKEAGRVWCWALDGQGHDGDRGAQEGEGDGVFSRR